MIGSTAKSDDQSQDHDTNHDDDLETGQPELKFAEETDTKVVDANNDDEEHGDPYSWIDFVAGEPVLDDQSSGSQLVGSDDDVLEPITMVTSSVSQGLLSPASSLFLSLFPFSPLCAHLPIS